MTMLGEVVALLIVVMGAVFVAFRALKGVQNTRIRLVAIGVLFVVTSVSAATLRPSIRAAPPPAPETPGSSTSIAYASSSACLGCHPGEHASFSRTYHRTMTQVATPSSVLAPLDGHPFENRNGEVWARLSPGPSAISRRVVLTTGSHREQAYWVKGERAGDLRLVPFVWFVREQALVPRRDAFIVPPDAPMPKVRWASSCIACHAVAGEPRHDPEKDAFDTRVVELGIACEACHGPGAAHIARFRDPVARYMQNASTTSSARDDLIVNPAHLTAERSAAVCGQCHAYAFPRDENGWWTDGYSRTFRAGDALEPSRTILTAALLLDSASGASSSSAPVIDAPSNAIFWPDGAVRVGGREYNGLIESPCYVHGAGDRKMTCISCHSMHKGDVEAGQIAPDRRGDRGCTSCHSDARSQSHSHHAAGSVGSACVSCHMAKTSYALLSAVRSHRIESPHAEKLDETNKPNACNLCHLDRSLAWTARYLSEWYGGGAPSGGEPPLSANLSDTPFALREGLVGDAGVRALIADALGSSDAALAMKDTSLRAGVLDQMRKDPYAAVRFMAARSRRELPDDRSPNIDSVAASLIKDRDARPITIAE